MNKFEVNGLVFTKRYDDAWSILDLSYGCAVGILKLEDGPGWILTDIMPFLDWGHLHNISKFIERLDT